jgi:fatty-acyl-CoA synthase
LPRFVRLVDELPVTATGKINKQPLRAAAWRTKDAVWWRRPRELAYERLTDDDVAALGRELDRNGRAALL